MRSNREIVNELRTIPSSWMDAAIVVVLENQFKFVGEDHPDPMIRLNSLQEQGGLAIGLAGVKATAYTDRAFVARVFEEYQAQGWAHQYMDTLRRIVRVTNSRLADFSYPLCNSAQRFPG
ncbi:MAG TPA: hypothetical protein VE422_27350 [Terriglobia bacterium]|nr:hypothetical protein [Terriglobia bacterium]